MKVREPYIKNKVNNLLLSTNTYKYPINIFDLIKKINNINISLKPYSKLILHFESFNHLIETFKSDEGVSFYMNENNKELYQIFYNDFNKYSKNFHKININQNNLKTIERQRWTLAHELGHIILDHHKFSDSTCIHRKGLKDSEYSWMEDEADKFAEILLANPVVLLHIPIKTVPDIMNICQISRLASKNRMKDISILKNNLNYISYEDKITLNIFNSFINSRKCQVCQTTDIHGNSNFCNICGNNFIWGVGEMKYSGIELDINNRAIECPNCKNSEIKNGDFCNICGAFIKNTCLLSSDYQEVKNGNDSFSDNCDTLLPGNARFCHNCGNISSFYDQHFLDNVFEENTTDYEEIYNPVLYTDDDVPF